MTRVALLPSLCAFPAAPGLAQDTAVVLRGARIHTVSGAILENATLAVAGGKIIAAGGPDLRAPAGATVRDVSGKVIIPGLVDTHSHIGIYPRPAVPANQDGNEMTGPAQGILRALDAIWPADPGIRMALAGADSLPGGR